jgi:hypothetical protein
MSSLTKAYLGLIFRYEVLQGLAEYENISSIISKFENLRIIRKYKNEDANVLSLSSKRKNSVLVTDSLYEVYLN